MDPDLHLLSLEIFGTWKVEAELTKRVDGNFDGCDITRRISDESLPKSRFVFTKDEDASRVYEKAINKVLAHYDTQLAAATQEDKPDIEARIRRLSEVWATGRYDFGGIAGGKGCFGLVVGFGAPRIVYVPDGQRPGLPDLESSFIQLARDPDGDKDVLVYGGEHLNDRCGFLVRDLDSAKGDARVGDKSVDPKGEAKPDGDKAGSGKGSKEPIPPKSE